MEFVPGSHTPLRTIRVAGGADALAAGFGFVWVVSGSVNSVTPIDARSGTPLPAIAVGNGPTAISVGAGSVWVANGLDGTVSKIDPSTSSASPPIPVGGNLAGVAAGNGVVWVSDSRAGTLSRIDPTADKLVQTVHTTNPPGGLAVAAGKLYVGVGAPASAHRGGTLTVQGRAVRLDRPRRRLSDPRLVVGADLDERRPGDLPARRRRQRHPGRARPGDLAADADRRRPHLHLQGAPRDPLLDGGARPAGRLPPRHRTRVGLPEPRGRLLRGDRRCRSLREQTQAV